MDKDKDTPNSDMSLEDRLDQLWQQREQMQPSALSESVSGRRVGKYMVQRPLGSGGFGVVYLARATELDPSVALKIPRVDALLDADKRKRFKNEAEMASRLEHVGIVTFYEAVFDTATPYIANEFCRGENLAQWLAEQDEPPPWQDAVGLMIKICQAIEHAHSRGVAHRDLKPANVMLVLNNTIEKNGLADVTPKVTDFGLGKIANE